MQSTPKGGTHGCLEALACTTTAAGPLMLVAVALVGSSISALETEGEEWQFLSTVLKELEGRLVSFLPGLPLL